MRYVHEGSGLPMSGWMGILAAAVAAFLLFVGLRLLRDKMDDYFWGVSILFTIAVAIAYGALL